MNWECTIVGAEKIKILIHNVQDPVRGDYLPTPDQLQGITFYVPNHTKAKVFIGNQEVHRFQKNPPDFTGNQECHVPSKVFAISIGLPVA